VSLTRSAESRYTGADSGKLIARLHKRPERWTYQEQGAPTSPPRTSARASTTRTRLLEAVTDAGPEGITYTELGRLPGFSRDKAKRHLPRMREEGLVEPDGDGTKTDNYRWKLKEHSRGSVRRTEGGDAIAA
jgi:DNA-binding IclR family transcriptional regulator